MTSIPSIPFLFFTQVLVLAPGSLTMLIFVLGVRYLSWHLQFILNVLVPVLCARLPLILVLRRSRGTWTCILFLHLYRTTSSSVCASSLLLYFRINQLKKMLSFRIQESESWLREAIEVPVLPDRYPLLGWMICISWRRAENGRNNLLEYQCCFFKLETRVAQSRW